MAKAPHSKRDSDILAELLALHHIQGTPLADMSWGLGRLWTAQLRQQYQPIGVDIDPAKGADIVGDWNRQDAYFEPYSIGTLVWDPPHMSDDRGGLGYAEKYGTGTASLRGAGAVIDLFEPFLRSARQSLIPQHGTLIVKLADQVHDERLQFQAYWLWKIATEDNWFDCDRFERQRPQPPHNTTITQRHIRRGVTHWLVFHNTWPCPGEGVAVLHTCPGCGQLFKPSRRDQKTCSDRCRQRLARATP